jgi:hypothetical protein
MIDAGRLKSNFPIPVDDANPRAIANRQPARFVAQHFQLALSLPEPRSPPTYEPTMTPTTAKTIISVRRRNRMGAGSVGGP